MGLLIRLCAKRTSRLWTFRFEAALAHTSILSELVGMTTPARVGRAVGDAIASLATGGVPIAHGAAEVPDLHGARHSAARLQSAAEPCLGAPGAQLEA